MGSGPLARSVLASLVGLSLAGLPAAAFAQSGKETSSAGKRWEEEFSLWQKVSSGSDIAQYEGYLKQYPNGTFASMARLRCGEGKGRRGCCRSQACGGKGRCRREGKGGGRAAEGRSRREEGARGSCGPQAGRREGRCRSKGEGRSRGEQGRGRSRCAQAGRGKDRCGGESQGRSRRGGKGPRRRSCPPEGRSRQGEG